LEEIILSFNEISLNSGIEISKLLAKKMKCLQLLDLNGNKFGEEGKLEILSILKPIEQAVTSLSEDEGSDEEEEEESDGLAEEDSGDEEAENSEVVVDGEEDYDEVDDYEDYEDEEEYSEEDIEENKFGSADIAPHSNLFKPFNKNNIQTNLGQLNLNDNKNKVNLFSAMVANSFLKTNSIPLFDAFVAQPNLQNLRAIDEASFKNLIEVF
jgi:hypothetical protein